MSLNIDAVMNGMEERSDTRAHVRWLPPSFGEVALNCDGIVTGAGMNASCGGLLRDEDGHFIFGFAPNLGSCSILAAELWGIFHGLRMAWNRGFQNIVVYSDSKNAIDLLTAGCVRSHAYFNLIEAIHRIHQGSNSIRWKHILREANQVANCLAKFGLDLDSQFRIFYVSPSFIYKYNALRADAHCICFPRGF